MNERDDEIAKLIYGTQATYQEMQFAALIRADERKSIVTMLKDEVNVETAADCIWEIEARENK